MTVADDTEAPLRRIRQPIRGRGLRKLLWKRLRLPRGLVHPALSAAKALANPRQVRLRRQLAEALASDPSGDAGAISRIPEARGFLRVPPGELPGTAAVLARCREIYDAMRKDAEVDDHLFNPRKRFLLALLSGGDFCEHPDLLRFMVSRPVLDRATAYLGSVPILAGAALWWTPQNDTELRSQRFHLDGEDERQVKLLLNVFDTTDDNGPFTFLPADASRPITRNRDYRARLSDDEVDASCGLDNAIALTGPAGSGGFVDTSRCLHYGSRRTRKDRLVLMVQFLRFHCPTESTFQFDVPPDLLGTDLDTHQMLALGLE